MIIARCRQVLHDLPRDGFRRRQRVEVFRAVVVVAAVARVRGPVHSLDVDRISVIDVSTRAFVGESRDPASVGPPRPARR